MQQMTKEDIEAIVDTGERFPINMKFDSSVLSGLEYMISPVFDGEKIVDQAEG